MNNKVLVIVLWIIIVSGVSFEAYHFFLKPDFSLLDISVPNKEVALYEDVKISVIVKNNGFLKGDYLATFSLDGVAQESKAVALGGRESGSIDFVVSFKNDSEWGERKIDINGKSATLSVNEGLHPIVRIGDTITSETTVGGLTSEIIELIVGESTVNNEECWVNKATFNPPLGNIFDEGEICADKTTFFPLKSTLSGIGAEVVRYSTYDVLSTEPIFPLRVGQIIIVRETDNITTTFLGQPLNKKETNIKKYYVEDIENINTPAGEMKAFKIDIKDEKDVLIATIWQAPKAKLNIIKMIDYETGDTQILKSINFLR